MSTIRCLTREVGREGEGECHAEMHAGRNRASTHRSCLRAIVTVTRRDPGREHLSSLWHGSPHTGIRESMRLYRIERDNNRGAVPPRHSDRSSAIPGKYLARTE